MNSSWCIGCSSSSSSTERAKVEISLEGSVIFQLEYITPDIPSQVSQPEVLTGWLASSRKLKLGSRAGASAGGGSRTGEGGPAEGPKNESTNPAQPTTPPPGSYR